MSFVDTDPVLISMALDRIQNLDANDYLVVLGPDDKQFLATPNGYSATYIPSRMVAELASGKAEKVLWASYGDAPDSWFFSYRFSGGGTAVRFGEDLPSALREYIHRINESSNKLLKTLRVQLGPKGSFIVWTGTAWACCNVPAALRDRLKAMSSATREANGLIMGSVRSGSITNVQWHSDGSYYVQKSNNTHSWSFLSSIVLQAWKRLWDDVEGALTPERLDELAYVAINAHAPTSDTFTFIKKQHIGEEAPFILHFDKEPVHARLPKAASQPIQQSASIPEGNFRWAISLKIGRSHHTDGWELNLKKGQTVKVFRDMGKNWFLAADQKGNKGWVHGSYLDFNKRKREKEPNAAWRRFEEDAQKLLGTRNIDTFLNMKEYVDVCTSPVCLIKLDPSKLGICQHDLEILLKGSGQYSPGWLKDGRNSWHPDRFARF